MVVDEDYKSSGLPGEIAATVAEEGPALLRAPLVRITVPDVPLLYARPLEYAVLPTSARIAESARKLVRK